MQNVCSESMKEQQRKHAQKYVKANRRARTEIKQPKTSKM